MQEAIQHPRELDQNLFDAQQARRVLDRLVGYQLSPLLWKKVRRGLSAGRVQSVAVRIIVEREREIRAFVPEEYWTVEARLEAGQPPPFAARLVEVDGQKVDRKQLRLDTKARVDEVARAASTARRGPSPRSRRKERRRHPTPPFITSRLQQEASRKLGFQPSRTMRIAQRLYEGVELGDEGAVGLITYMRTDSTRISGEAIAAVRELHRRSATAPTYVPEKPNVYRSKKDAQDAHEAIRPTSMRVGSRAGRAVPRAARSSRSTRSSGTASSPARWRRRSTTRPPSTSRRRRCRFRATGQVLKFDGFIRVYTEGRDDAHRRRRRGRRGPAAAAHRGRGG